MEDRPGVRVKPPLVLLAMMIAGAVLSLFAPARVSRRKVSRWSGIPILGMGIALLAAAIGRMRAAGTNVDPDLPATALVTGGPYRFTRNPIYLGLTLSYLGLGILANSLWFLPLAGAFMLVLRSQVIPYEEAYLENKFGETYKRYKNQVRRWV